MVHLVITFRVTAYITVAIHLCAPFFQGSRHLFAGILRGVRYGGFHIGDLRLGVGIEMGAGTVVPSEEIAIVSSTPTAESHTPTDSAMQPYFPVPVALGSVHNHRAEGVEIRVRGIYD